MKTSVLGIDATINVYQAGTMPKAIGSLIAIDTETELIDFEKPWLYPDVVVLTAYSGNGYVDFVRYRDIPEYLTKLLQATKESTYVFHNAPFDIGVLGFDLWADIVEQNRVWDTGLLFLLRCIAEEGYREDKEYPSLASLVKILFDAVLEKDTDIRCTFSRSNDDISMEHIAYACKDAIATWKCAMTLGDMPTIGTQVRGFIVLDTIRRNGLLVNKKQLQSLRTKYKKLMDVEKEKLLTWGIQIDKEPKTLDLLEWLKAYGIFIPYEDSQKTPIDFIKALLNTILEATRGSFNFAQLNAKINDVLTRETSKAPITQERLIDIEKELRIEFPRNVKGKISPNKRQLLNIIFYYLDNIEEGRDAAIKEVHTQWEKHAGWPTGYKEIGINTVLQGLLKEAEKQVGVKLPKTETGKYSLNEEDLSTIDEETLGQIPFLESFKNYKHYEKLCSTYLTEKYIKADGRVHTKLNPLMATGRTSSTQPNVQNVAKEVGIREMYIASPGYALVSCDYNQQELIALAQSCYTRFGKSLMRDLINNDIDIHGYMGSTIHGCFKGLDMLDVTKEDSLREYKKRIKDFKSSDPKRFKELRQLSKALDFGLPGGLGSARFVNYAKGYGVDITPEESSNLCALWKSTFPEMQKHLKPMPMFEEGCDGLYMTRILTGRWRRKCGFCAALNTEFQGLAADCSKEAGWKLLRARYYLVNFIHDEYIAEIPLDRHFTARCKEMAQIMIGAMQQITPDVKVKAVPAAMLKWCKAAEDYYDGEGDLIPWEWVPKDQRGDMIDWNDLDEASKRRILKEKHERLYKRK